jgi:type III secretion protein N (ATPase)
MRYPTRREFVHLANNIAGSMAAEPLIEEIGWVRHVSSEQVVAQLQNASLGEICHLLDRENGRRILTQVVAIDGNVVKLSPLEPIDGLSAATDVIATGSDFRINVGSALIGRVLDGLSRPLDQMPIPKNCRTRPLRGIPIDPLNRLVIDKIFHTGVKAIDLFNTLGLGQRIAILGEPGSGKSTLLGMLARHAESDVIVIAMIGERGREVREFLDRQIPPEIRKRCIAVVSTSDRPAMERLIAGHAAMSIAEDLRDQGRDVLLLFDSITRFARALREIGLSSGEQAVRQGYTPSVYAEMPRLVERCGKTATGSITGLFTVLLENQGVNDAMSEEVASLLDGHLMLDAKMSGAGHHPAIDLLRSKSRLMSEIAPAKLIASASRLKGLISKYQEIEMLVQIGEYQKGSDPEGDRAIRAWPQIATLTKQAVKQVVSFEDMLEQIYGIVDDVEAETGEEDQAD